MKPCSLLSVVTLLLICSGNAFAQGFPYDDFLPRTLSEIISENKEIGARTKEGSNAKQHFIIDGDPLPSVVRVTYTDKTRKLDDRRLDYLKIWLTTTSKDPALLELFEEEMLFKEGASEYWLPVQKQLIAHFRKEITEGEPVDLYLIRLGGFLGAPDWNWMFMVEEFRKPGTSGEGIFPWNDFEPRSIEQLIAISLKNGIFSKREEKKEHILLNELFSSRVRATYTAQSRPITGDRLKLIEHWVGEFATDPAYSELYQKEYLFREGKNEYWIPVAKLITNRLERDVKKNDELNLYLVSVGGVKTGVSTDWVFLIEEFRNVNSVKK